MEGQRIATEKEIYKERRGRTMERDRERESKEKGGERVMLKERELISQ